jgi:hypothetical protein
MTQERAEVLKNIACKLCAELPNSSKGIILLSRYMDSKIFSAEVRSIFREYVCADVPVNMNVEKWMKLMGQVEKTYNLTTADYPFSMFHAITEFGIGELSR